MPLYEYECANHHRTERVRKIAERHDPLACACGEAMTLTISRPHVEPDGVYSYAPNIGDPDRFERQRHAIREGIKTIPRVPDTPADHRDGQLSPRQRHYDD